MTLDEIKQTIQPCRRCQTGAPPGAWMEWASRFALPVHPVLSSAINDRKDEYGGSVRKCALSPGRHQAIRKEVGKRLPPAGKNQRCRQQQRALPWEKKGNTLEESIQICKWVEAAGADALHVSMGSMFPHPQLPSGGFPADEARTGGTATWFRAACVPTQLHCFTTSGCGRFFSFWNGPRRTGRWRAYVPEEAREVKKNVGIPVLNTGGYQNGAPHPKVISENYCDGVTIARPLIASNDCPRSSSRAATSRASVLFLQLLSLSMRWQTPGLLRLEAIRRDRDAMIREAMRAC
jgi:2,4-dienoyl-CoA reductase (NADPH2)